MWGLADGSKRHSFFHPVLGESALYSVVLRGHFGFLITAGT